jgi:uncharacterized protein
MHTFVDDSGYGSPDHSRTDSSAPAEPPAWRPLSPTDRRVVGVLVEKAKTVPTGYPMTLNAIVTGANQKNNRDPQTQLTAEQVQDSLDRLREVGAVGEVQGDGRVPKYRHYMYKWLGVDKAELAVMTELLLRGAQTVGDLRTRAARMEPIADQSALRPVLSSLAQKKLLVFLTPEGRGQMVSHGLYPPDELKRVQSQASAAPFADPPSSPRIAPSPQSDPLWAEIGSMRDEISQLRRDLDELRKSIVHEPVE